MTQARVPFDLLTKSSHAFQLFTGNASDLGWAPGFWPDSVIGVSPSGHSGEYECVKVELDGTHVYQGVGLSATIRIFND